MIFRFFQWGNREENFDLDKPIINPSPRRYLVGRSNSLDIFVLVGGEYIGQLTRNLPVNKLNYVCDATSKVSYGFAPADNGTDGPIARVEDYLLGQGYEPIAPLDNLEDAIRREPLIFSAPQKDGRVILEPSSGQIIRLGLITEESRADGGRNVAPFYHTIG